MIFKSMPKPTASKASASMVTASKRTRGVRTAVTAGLAAALLTACGTGGEEGATTPQGWSTLTTDRLTVAHPAEFKQVAAADLAEGDAAGAVRTKDGAPVGSIYVEFDYGQGINDADMAGTAAEARVQLGATPSETTEIEVAGPDGTAEARRVDWTSTSTGAEGQPPKGTKLAGVMIAGLDTKDRPYLITVNAEKGLLSDKDIKDIVAGVSLK
ncbi:hypothetical protein ACIBJC_12400 [Streptomyces sp. NPDC050509]|uniref:hypothetical protein n=1 Tax=Streptomyces sp. NPDC050509 TaxID=3365620 RepID=UPI00378C7BC3